MTRAQVMLKAINGEITWIQAAEICGITDRQMRRLKIRYAAHGFDGLVDGRAGRRPRRRRIPLEQIEEICRLKREKYPDFSVQHFYEQLTEQEAGFSLSYSWTLRVLEEAGVVAKAPGRGKYRRRRERRPMTGMLLHLDASRHPWIEDEPQQDLVVCLDDADGRILYARFVPEEGTLSSLHALESVLRRHGRFCALYTDRGSHFCLNPKGGRPTTDHDGQVTRVLRALGIQQILALSPQARGRSERNFGTLQGRLPQELRLHGIRSYERANRYLEETFIPDFNRRFTVVPQQKESAFVRLAGVDLELLLAIQHERVVGNDHVIKFFGRALQLPQHRRRPSFARCPVLVHEFPNGTLGVSYQGRLLARYDPGGEILPSSKRARPAA